MNNLNSTRSIKTNKKFHSAIFATIVIFLFSSCEGSEDQYIDESTPYAIGFGALLFIVGYIIEQIEVLASFGRILKWIGAIFGGLALLMVVFYLLEIALKAILYLAIGIGIIVGIIWVISEIYKWLTGNKK